MLFPDHAQGTSSLSVRAERIAPVPPWWSACTILRRADSSEAAVDFQGLTVAPRA
jgi:hypothetical protein